MSIPPVFAASALYDNLLQAALRQFFDRATFETEAIPSLSSDGRLAIEPTSDPSELTIRWFGSRHVLHVPERRPFTAHEELNTKCMEFQPLVFQTRFDDTSGSYALLGVANLAGTRQFTHTETSTCKPPFTRTDPPTPYTSSVGYMIDGKVEPDAPSFSGSKFTEDVGERCDWTWNFSRL